MENVRLGLQYRQEQRRSFIDPQVLHKCGTEELAVGSSACCNVEILGRICARAFA